ncbi:MAG TPA: RidA family protein [Alphaproteobacteria bacterium]|nr:RidA family protein [Alphaproteobacteria bacterium]
MRMLQPPGWPRPKGYSNGVVAEGRLIFVAGMVGWKDGGRFESDSFVEQVRQALKNILAVLAEAGGEARHIARLTWYVTDKQEYLANLSAVGAAYREVIGNHFPAMALVEVGALVEDRAKVEIEATAVVP